MDQIFDGKLPYSDKVYDELSGLEITEELYRAWTFPYGTDDSGAARRRMIVRDVLPHLAEILDDLYVMKESERYMNPGDIVVCTDARTWPFLTKGETYVVSTVYTLDGRWIKLYGQPYDLLSSLYTAPVIDWLPAEIFERV